MICCFQNLVSLIEPKLLAKFDETCWGHPWECLKKCLDFESCNLIFKITRGQKVTNQIQSCVHDTFQTSNFDETPWDYALVVQIATPKLLFQTLHKDERHNRPKFYEEIFQTLKAYS